MYLYDGDAAKLTASHDGERNNEIGAYSGTVPLSSGPSVISVQADGSWTLTVK